MFGQNTQQQQPAAGAFGQPATNTGGGLFGQQNQAQPQQPATGLFGQTTTNTTGTGLFGQPAQQQQGQTNAFGATTTPSFGGGGLFGAKPATTTGVFGMSFSIFMRERSTHIIDRFDSSSARDDRVWHDWGIWPNYPTWPNYQHFRTASKSAEPAAAATRVDWIWFRYVFWKAVAANPNADSFIGATNTAAKPLFGQPAQPSTGLFGQPAQPAQPATGLFGQPAQNTNTQPGQTGSLFGGGFGQQQNQTQPAQPATGRKFFSLLERTT